MPKTVKLVGAFFVPLFIVMLVACGQNAGQGDSTSATPTANGSASSSPTVNNVPQPVRTDISYFDIPQPEETNIAVATQAVLAATAVVENATQTAVAVATIQAYMRLTPTVPPDEEVGHGDFGSWNYRAVRRNGQQIVAGINFDSSSVSVLNAYAAANRAEAAQLAMKGGEANVHITFRTYVAPAKFRSWATAMGLRVERSDIRLVADGKDAVMGIGGTESDSLPQDSINKSLQPLTEHGVNISTVRGVYFTVGTLNASRLVEFAADPLVFLPDVTVNVVRNELIAAQVPGAEQADISINFPVTPFWKMEHDFGLDKFQK